MSSDRRILTSVLRVSGRDQPEASIVTIDLSQVTSWPCWLGGRSRRRVRRPATSGSSRRSSGYPRGSTSRDCPVRSQGTECWSLQVRTSVDLPSSSLGILKITERKKEYLIWSENIVQGLSQGILWLMRVTEETRTPSHPQKPRRPQQSQVLWRMAAWGPHGRTRWVFVGRSKAFIFTIDQSQGE